MQVNITKFLLVVCSTIGLQQLGFSADPLPANQTPPASSIPMVTEAEANQKLMMAYKKEFVFLDQEIRALKERQQELNSLYVEKKSKSEVDIEALEKKLIDVRNQIDFKMDLMTQKEEVVEQAKGNADLVDVALTQMIVSLERYKIGTDVEFEKLENGTQKLQAVSKLFSEAFMKLDNLNKTIVSDSQFYDMQGRLLNGKVITVGQNMAFGTSDSASGVLAPAGGGKFMLWNGDGSEVAQLLAKGSQPASTYPAYLYEDVNKQAMRVEDKQFEDILEAGGIIGYVILCLGAVAVLLVLVRMLLLALASSNTRTLVSAVGEMIKADKKDEAVNYLEKKSGAAARVLLSTIRHLHYKPSMLEDVIAESVLHETPRLEKFESAITVIAAVAPLLGLLGTVTGMISTFDVITLYGTGDPKMLSGGISEALVTTEMGLTVAIPLLLLGNLLSGWSEKIMSSIEHSALSVTNISRQ